MKLLPLLFGLFLLQIRDSLGLIIRNTLSNSQPRLGETITLRCNIADGTASGVSWWKDKHQGPKAVYLSFKCIVVSEEYKSRLSNVRCDTKNYDFQLKNVELSDRGDWGCEANGQEATHKLRLDVLVPPQTPTVTNPSPVNVGDTAKFTCNAENVNITKPVSYTWTKNGKMLSPGTTEPRVLLITPVNVGHAGKYVCVAKNDAGSISSTEQELIVNCPPSAPSELEVVNSTAVAVTLKWISEFNGGYEQRFYVQYKTSADNWDVAMEVPQGGITDPGLKKVVHYRVMALESNVSYQFRVHSRNSHPETHMSNFSNTAAGKTPEKPQTFLVGVNRTNNKVTVRWKQVIGRYTVLKIRYCQTGTEDCWIYTVPNPKDKTAAFFVEADKTYYYHLIVEDGGDVVYRSTDFKYEVDDMSNSQAVAFKTNNTVFAVVGGVVGAGIIVAITVVILAVVLWKRALSRWGQSHRPANDDTRISMNVRPSNDTVVYDDTRVEVTAARNISVQAYANIGTECENDAFRPKRTPSQNAMGHYLPMHGVDGGEPATTDDEVDTYDYVDSPMTRQRAVSGQSRVLGNQTAYDRANEGFRQNVSSGKTSAQESHEHEGTNNNSRIPVQGEPGPSTAGSGSSQAEVARKQPPICSTDDTANGRQSPYAHLDPVMPVKHGEYLDLTREPSKE